MNAVGAVAVCKVASKATVELFRAGERAARVAAAVACKGGIMTI